MHFFSFPNTFNVDTNPESVLYFDDAAVEDGGLHILRNGNNLCDVF